MRRHTAVASSAAATVRRGANLLLGNVVAQSNFFEQHSTSCLSGCVMAWMKPNQSDLYFYRDIFNFKFSNEGWSYTAEWHSNEVGGGIIIPPPPLVVVSILASVSVWSSRLPFVCCLPPSPGTWGLRDTFLSAVPLRSRAVSRRAGGGRTSISNTA